MEINFLGEVAKVYVFLFFYTFNDTRAKGKASYSMNKCF